MFSYDKDISEADVETLKNYKYQGSEYTYIDNLLNKFWYAAVEFVPKVVVYNLERSA